MAFGVPGRPRQKLGVLGMAIALAGAAFAGAALGLVWQSSGFGEDEEEEVLIGEEAMPASG